MIKFLTFVLISIAPASIACRCTGNDIGYLLAKSHKAYLGKVSHSSALGEGTRIAASLTVLETFKGDTFKVEEVTTDNTSCGVSFTINDTYLVFEAQDGFVYQCSMSNTKFYDRHGNLEKDLDYLRSLRK
jgi:hypothetical protein